MPHTDEAGCFPSSAIWGGGGRRYLAGSTLPLGEWHVMANGRIHFLNIISVSGGIVKAEYNDLPIEGRWDGRVLTFTRVETRGIDLRQNFTGYLMNYLEPDPKWRMAGVFQNERKDDPIGPAGWYATRPRES
jgi:hypothetical protein